MVVTLAALVRLPDGALSLGYGILGIYWTLGGDGFPFGHDNDHEAEYSVLANVSEQTAAPLFAGFGLLGAAVALLMARRTGRGPVRLAVLVFAWTAAATLSFGLTDVRLLMLVTRILVTPVFAVTGVPGGGSVTDFYTWPRLNLLVLVVGGLLWGLAALAYQRHTRGACATCGRGDGSAARWAAPDHAVRWGRWAVCVAAAVPSVYALSRIAMALGSPVGVLQSFYAEMEGSGVVVGDLVMAGLALGGAVLTTGLVRRWGEVFPRWIYLARASGCRRTGPGTLWPLWGVALGAATYAYYLRRRTRCRDCGEGPDVIGRG